MNQNSELILIEYNVDHKSKYIKNTFENLEIKDNSVFEKYCNPKTKSNGYFYKSIFGSQDIIQAIKILF